MKPTKILLAFACSFPPLLTGCNSAYRANDSMPATSASHWSGYWGGRIPTAMPTTGEIKGLPTYGIPFQLPGSQTWISSFVITEDPWIFRDADSFSEGGLAGSGTNQTSSNQQAQFRSINVRWHDAVFSNGQGTESWSLLNQRGYISNWWLLVESNDGVPHSRLSVFAAVIDDTNDDGYLNDKDAAVAIVTDGDGRHTEIATPDHMQLTAVHYVPNSELLGFEVREDKDGDGKFSSDEPIHYYFRYPFADSPVTKPWHTDAFQDGLESRYR